MTAQQRAEQQGTSQNPKASNQSIAEHRAALLDPGATDDSTAKSRAAGSLSKALRLQIKAQQSIE